jgi:hypothetical protein
LQDVLLLLSVLIWVVKIGADIDQMRANHIEYLAGQVMELSFRVEYAEDSRQQKQWMAAIRGLEVVQRWLMTTRQETDTPKILGLPMQTALLTSIVG